MIRFSSFLNLVVSVTLLTIALTLARATGIMPSARVWPMWLQVGVVLLIAAYFGILIACRMYIRGRQVIEQNEKGIVLAVATMLAHSVALWLVYSVIKGILVAPPCAKVLQDTDAILVIFFFVYGWYFLGLSGAFYRKFQAPSEVSAVK